MAVFPRSEVGMAEVVRAMDEVADIWGVVGDENSQEINFALLDEEGQTAIADVQQYLHVLPTLFEMNYYMEAEGVEVVRRLKASMAEKQWVVSKIREEGKRGFEHMVSLDRIMAADGFYCVTIAELDDFQSMVEVSSIPGNSPLFQWSEVN